MRYEHSLGLPGGARGIDHVSQIVRQGAGWRVAGRIAGQLAGQEVEADEGPRFTAKLLLISLFHERNARDGLQDLVRGEFFAVAEHVPHQLFEGELPFAQHQEIKVGLLRHEDVIAGCIGASRDDGNIDSPLSQKRKSPVEKLPVA